MFEKVKEYGDNCYLAKKKFGKDTYYLWAMVTDQVNVYIALSSGNKRRDMLTFPQFYSKYAKLKFMYIVPADSRRRRIYKRSLEKYGFREERISFGLVLCKRL